MNDSVNIQPYEVLVCAEKALEHNPPEMKSNYWFGFASNPTTALAVSMTMLLLFMIMLAFILLAHLFGLPTSGLRSFAWILLVISGVSVVLNEAISHFSSYRFPDRDNFEYSTFQQLQEAHCASQLAKLDFDIKDLKKHLKKSISYRKTLHSLFMTIGVVATLLSTVGFTATGLIEKAKNGDQTAMSIIVIYAPFGLAFLFYVFFNQRRINRLKRVKLVLKNGFYRKA